MSLQKIIIIGNPFEKFSNNNSVMTVDTFNLLLKNKSTLCHEHSQYEVYLGQGLSDFQLACIIKNIKDSTWSDRFFFNGLLYALRHSPKTLLYRRNHPNTLISEPEKISPHVYRSFLLLDEAFEFGNPAKYIKGNTLIEASRQAVTEVSKTFLTQSHLEPKACIIHQFNTTFYGNMLPLDVELVFKITEIRHGLYGNLKARGTLEGIQNKKTLFSVDVDFSSIDKSILCDIESYQEEQHLDQWLNPSAQATLPLS